MRRFLTLAFAFIATVFFGMDLCSQEYNGLYLDALKAYENGRFLELDSLLRDDLTKLDKEHQVQAYRLLTLGALMRDEEELAEDYATSLLNIDPFYSSYGDSPRFSDLLTSIKGGSSTITTASNMAESVEEVPVPVTLITEEMIKASGATKLQDILLLYVPGMSAISGLEDNVAMRGVSGLAQEVMLVMLDGHRLNSLSTNAEAFDFRNGIEKIKQIEVLRGPASSLYGNVSLCAVVNIITKSGADLEGGKISLMTGSNDTKSASALFGNGNFQSEFLVWGSVYSSEGEKVTSGTSTHYLGGYNAKPTYDLGGKIRWGDFNFEFTGRHSHPVPFYNLLEVSDCTYDKYDTFDGNKPGMSTTSVRGDVEWSHSWKKWSVSASVYLSTERQQIYNCMGDTISYPIIAALASALNIPSVKTKGVRQIIDWQDFSLGGLASASYDYKMGGVMKGNIMFGVQQEVLMPGDASLMLGADFNNTNTTLHSIILDGDERTFSTFTQVKHYFTKSLIFNGGFRYDLKKRIEGRKINTFSPRMSLIWRPGKFLTFKSGYSHSFVDAAAFYRGSTISLFSGGTDLNPENMDSYQFGTILDFRKSGLRYEFNTFYNEVKDLVSYNAAGGGSGGSTFTNSGAINMGGLENVIQFNRDRIFANLNFTYQYPFKVDGYFSTHSVSNVPRFLLNSVAQYALVSKSEGQRLYVRANAHYQGKFDCLNNDLLLKMTDPSASLSYEQKQYTVVGAGIEWKGAKGLDLSVDAYNIGDADYEIGGILKRGVPGAGRSFIFRASYEF